MSRQTYSEEVKAAAMASLLEGQSVSAVAKEYEIPKGTVSHWKTKASRGVREERTQKKPTAGQDIGDLLMELLEANIRSLVSIAEVSGDKGWLKEQGAAEIATLFGVKHDKAIRMIEALNQANATDAEGD